MKLPSGLQIFVKSGIPYVDSIKDLTLIPGTDGFEPLAPSEVSGPDINVAIFDTHAEAVAYSNGFSRAGCDNHTSTVCERVFSPAGDINLFVAFFGDSGADDVVVDDYRAAALNAVAA